MLKHFKSSLLVFFLGIIAAFWWGRFSALVLTLMLSILEISLSFDNAVLNSYTLQKMDAQWQARFLNWGIFISVFLVRILLPFIIIAIVTHLNISDITQLAFYNPSEYAKYLESSKASLSAFGGMFLIMVFLSFIFDQQKNVHWLETIERKLSQVGRLQLIEVILALGLLITIETLALAPQKLEIILSGSIGIVLFVILNTVTALLNRKIMQFKHSGLIHFLYLEILDASFSLDGVIGAFAITKDIVVIFLGLSIGAIFVRSLTIFLVHKGTLRKYRYLEHGAHYAIGALALIMLANIKFHISEIVTGCIGVGLIGLALLSSIRDNHRQKT